MTLSEQLAHYQRQLEIQRRIEAARIRFGGDLVKFVNQRERNQKIIDAMKPKPNPGLPQNKW